MTVIRCSTHRRAGEKQVFRARAESEADQAAAVSASSALSWTVRRSASRARPHCVLYNGVATKAACEKRTRFDAIECVGGRNTALRSVTFFDIRGQSSII